LITTLRDMGSTGLDHSRFQAAKAWCTKEGIDAADANTLISAMLCEGYLESRDNVKAWLYNPGNVLAALGEWDYGDVREAASWLYDSWEGASRQFAEGLNVPFADFVEANDDPGNIHATAAFSSTVMGRECREELKKLALAPLNPVRPKTLLWLTPTEHPHLCRIVRNLRARPVENNICEQGNKYAKFAPSQQLVSMVTLSATVKLISHSKVIEDMPAARDVMKAFDKEAKGRKKSRVAMTPGTGAGSSAVVQPLKPRLLVPTSAASAPESGGGGGGGGKKAKVSLAVSLAPFNVAPEKWPKKANDYNEYNAGKVVVSVYVPTVGCAKKDTGLSRRERCDPASVIMADVVSYQVGNGDVVQELCVRPWLELATRADQRRFHRPTESSPTIMVLTKNVTCLGLNQLTSGACPQLKLVVSAVQPQVGMSSRAATDEEGMVRPVWALKTKCAERAPTEEEQLAAVAKKTAATVKEKERKTAAANTTAAAAAAAAAATAPAEAAAPDGAGAS
jgi:hypothetical protein